MAWTLRSWGVRPYPQKRSGFVLLGSSYVTVGLFAPGFAVGENRTTRSGIVPIVRSRAARCLSDRRRTVLTR